MGKNRAVLDGITQMNDRGGKKNRAELEEGGDIHKKSK